MPTCRHTHVPSSESSRDIARHVSCNSPPVTTLSPRCPTQWKTSGSTGEEAAPKTPNRSHHQRRCCPEGKAGLSQVTPLHNKTKPRGSPHPEREKWGEAMNLAIILKLGTCLLTSSRRRSVSKQHLPEKPPNPSCLHLHGFYQRHATAEHATGCWGSAQPGELFRRDYAAHLCKRQTSVAQPAKCTHNTSTNPEFPRQQRCWLPHLHSFVLVFQCQCFRKEGEKTLTVLWSAGLVSEAVAAPKRHPCNGCWKRLFKIQQPLCLTTRSDLWYFLPKQFICLAQQLINSRGHPSWGLARAGPAAGPDGGCVSGINTILIDYTASGRLPNTRGARSAPAS